MNYADVISVKRPIEKSRSDEELDLLKRLSIESDTNDENHDDEDNDEVSNGNDGDAIDKNDDLNDDLKDESYENDSDEETEEDDDEDDDIFLPAGQKDKSVKLWTQDKLNDLVRELNIPKDGAEYLALASKGMNQLTNSTKVSFYRKRSKSFEPYFEEMNHDGDKIVYCKDVKGLMNEIKPNVYKDEEWRLFIDSSNRSLKAVLLHNSNHYASVPIVHSTTMKETYDNLKIILQKIQYDKPKWCICGDLKVSGILLGQQSGLTKTPCFLCLWDSRDRVKHYKNHKWPERKNNVIATPLVDPKEVLISPLHIKLGVMKQFVKALDKDGKCLKFMERKFPRKSYAKLKKDIFDGPEIRKMMADDQFISSMTKIEKAAWLSFKEVIVNFFGNRRSLNYKVIVSKMVENFGKMGCVMNYKLHFLHNHLDSFPENYGDYSEEQGEHFHQDVKVMEKRYQGRWDTSMLSDYCWMLKRDCKTTGKNVKGNLCTDHLMRNVYGTVRKNK